MYVYKYIAITLGRNMASLEEYNGAGENTYNGAKFTCKI
jgi:hypothetical protein